MTLTLISATPSPFARKVRIALIEKGVEFVVQNEVPWHADTQTSRYNPLEQLPILIPDDGDPVFESTYLMDWVEYRYPHPSMLPDDPDLAMQARLVHVIAEGVVDAMLLLFWEMQRDSVSADWTKRQLRKVKGGLADLDRRVGEREFIVGDRFGMADIAVIAMLGAHDTMVEVQMIPAWQQYAPDMDSWRELYANLVRFEAHHRDRPSVMSTGPRMFDLVEKVV
jgi:glutathione S-transferase